MSLRACVTLTWEAWYRLRPPYAIDHHAVGTTSLRSRPATPFQPFCRHWLWPLAGGAAYASVLNLPLKRAEVKGKLRDTAEAFADELDKALLEESSRSIEATVVGVREAVLPWAMAAADEAAAVVDAEQRRSSCEDAVRALQARVRAL